MDFWKKNKEKILEWLIYCLPPFFVVFPWFFKSGYLFFIDFVWGPNVPIHWSQNMFLPYGFLKILGLVLPYAFVEKLFIFFGFFILLAGGRKIAKQFLVRPTAVFSVSLFALFNPFVYDRIQYGQIGIVYALGFLLLSIGFFIAFRKNIETNDLYFASLFAALSILFSPAFFFFIVPVAAFFLITIASDHRSWNTLQILLKKIFFCLIIIAILNGNWLLGLLSGSPQEKYVSSGIGAQDVFAFQTVGNGTLEVVDNILHLSGFWGKEQGRYFDLTDWEWWGKSFRTLALLMVLGALYAFFSKKKRDRALLGGVAALSFIAVFLSLGIRTPISENVTYWLYRHLPFYKGLRETQKWVALLVPLYIILLSLGVNFLLELRAFSSSIFRKIFLILLSFLILMQAPFLLAGLNGQKTSVRYPDDWTEANAAIEAQSLQRFGKSCSGRTLFFPWHLYMQFNWIQSVTLNPAPYFFDCYVLRGTNMEYAGIYDNTMNEGSEQIDKWRKSKGATDLLRSDALGIRFLILAKEVDWREYGWLKNNPELELVRDFETLELYRVK